MTYKKTIDPVTYSLHIPTFLKPPLKKGLKLYRKIFSPFRVLPDFIIIGAAKCGTTSMFHYLMEHPNIFPPLNDEGTRKFKEIRFFDNNYNKGILWYKSHFPSILNKFFIKQICRKKFITGEGSPSYIYNKNVPKRVFQVNPDMKFIVLLRNPVERALSHYNFQVERKKENVTFENALKMETKRLQDTNYIWSGLDFSGPYLSAGYYANQLEEWFKLFPKEQFCIIESSELFSDPQKIYDLIIDFFNLPKFKLKQFKIHTQTQYYSYEINEDLRDELIKKFKPHNERLYKLKLKKTKIAEQVVFWDKDTKKIFSRRFNRDAFQKMLEKVGLKVLKKRYCGVETPGINLPKFITDRYFDSEKYGHFFYFVCEKS